jgi:S1-C subfamily serine protease
MPQQAQDEPKLPPNVEVLEPLAISNTLPNKLKNAVCRIELPGGGHGSGVAFDTEGNDTIVLTAAHVVDGGWGSFSPKVTFVIRGVVNGEDIVTLGRVIAISPVYDLATMRVTGRDFKPLALERGHVSNKKIIVAAVGYPLDIFPSIVTLGEAYSHERENKLIPHTAGIFFGNSGGPLVDLTSMRVIGIVVRIHVSDGFVRSNTGLAEPVEHIQDFLFPNESKKDGK